MLQVLQKIAKYYQIR